MRKAPAFQFYVDDFTGATDDWTHDEVGAYLRLLMKQFSNGPMTMDMITRALRGQKETLWPLLQTKFTEIENGLFCNKRLAEIMDIQVQNQKKWIKNLEKTSQKSIFLRKKKEMEMEPEMENGEGDGNGVGVRRKLGSKLGSKAGSKLGSKLESKLGSKLEEDAIYTRLVDYWFCAYEGFKFTKPTFGKTEGANLKLIILKIKTKLKEMGTDPNLENILSGFEALITFSMGDKWLSDHFSIQTINNQFDRIYAKARESNQAYQSDVVNRLIDNPFG